jgi:hypothetical protein
MRIATPTSLCDVKALSLAARPATGHVTREFDYTSFPEVVRSAADAFAQAGLVNPAEELALAEVHDCFTPTELILMEDLGFSERGKSIQDALAGDWRMASSGIGRRPCMCWGSRACRQGDHRQATAVERQSIRLRLPFDARYVIGQNLDVLAWSAIGEGDAERAARLFGAAQGIMRPQGASLGAQGHLAVLHERYQGDIRQTLGGRPSSKPSTPGCSCGSTRRSPMRWGSRNQSLPMG